MHATAWLERLAGARASRATGCSPHSRTLAPDAATVFTPLAGEAASSRPGVLTEPLAGARGPLAGDDHAGCSSAWACRCLPATRDSGPRHGPTTASRSAGSGASSRSVRRSRSGGDMVIESRPPGSGRVRRGRPGRPRGGRMTRRSRRSRSSISGSSTGSEIAPTVGSTSSCCRRSSAARRLEVIREAVDGAPLGVRPARRGRVQLRRPVDVGADHAGRPRPPPRVGVRAAGRAAEDVRCPYCDSARWRWTTPSARRSAARSSTAEPAASRSSRSRPSEPLEIIGVVGAGTMGAGIAQVALEARP